MSDYPMLISNKLHSFRNFILQRYKKRMEFWCISKYSDRRTKEQKRKNFIFLVTLPIFILLFFCPNYCGIPVNIRR